MRWEIGPKHCGIWEACFKNIGGRWGDGTGGRWTFKMVGGEILLAKTGGRWLIGPQNKVEMEVETSATPLSLCISNTPRNSIHRDVVKLHFFVLPWDVTFNVSESFLTWISTTQPHKYTVGCHNSNVIKYFLQTPTEWNSPHDTSTIYSEVKWFTHSLLNFAVTPCMEWMMAIALHGISSYY